MFYRPTSGWSWMLLLATVIETAIVVIAESIILSLNSNFSAQSPGFSLTRAVPTFMSLLIFGLIYQAMMVYDTLAQRNTVQLGALCGFAVCLSIYAALQTGETEKLTTVFADSENTLSTWRSMSIFIVVAIVLYNLIITWTSFQLYKEFQWTIYRQLNADLALQKKYLTFKVYTSVLKIDFFFFLGNSIQEAAFMGAVGSLNAPEFALMVLSMPATIGILIASMWFMRRENRMGMILVINSHIVLLAYFIFKVARMYRAAGSGQTYAPARKSLTFFAIMTIVLSVVTIGLAIKCMLNFNKGLKVHINSRRVAQSLLEDHEMELLGHHVDT